MKPVLVYSDLNSDGVVVRAFIYRMSFLPSHRVDGRGSD